ncbi:M23 family metallopeptidase [Streptomyces sp. NPDC097619]|uniref:M23 family metallopeptidase n=1 Tax=Streptomyces sp. NPDC097619 TaxID=3157228 RepID=UPI00331A9B9A
MTHVSAALAVTLLLSLLPAAGPSGPRLPAPTGGAAGAAAARASAAEPPARPSARGRPLPAPLRVLRWWDPPPHRYAAGHRGVDLAAPAGTGVRAVGAGRVHFAGRVAGRGVLSLTLPGGLRTTYQPVRPLVATGERVAAGRLVAVLTEGDHCPTTCLHWGLLAGDTYRDPLALLPRPGPRLLPLPR